MRLQRHAGSGGWPHNRFWAVGTGSQGFQSTHKTTNLLHACMWVHTHTHTHRVSGKIFHLQILLSFQGLTLPSSRTIRHMNHLKTLLIVLDSIKPV